MAAVGERLYVIHLPRTGGTAAISWLERAGIVQSIDGDAHRIPTPLEIGDREVFVCVRHPAYWLRSYQKFRQRGGRACISAADEYIDKEQSLAKLVACLPPGTIGELFDRYTLHGRCSRLLFGRTETLADDLDTVARIVGYNYGPNPGDKIPSPVLAAR